MQDDHDEIGPIAVSILEMISLFGMDQIEVDSISKFLPCIKIDASHSQIQDSLQLLAKFDFITIEKNNELIISVSPFIQNLMKTSLTCTKQPHPLEIKPDLHCETKYELLKTQLLSFSNQLDCHRSLSRNIILILESLWENSIKNTAIIKTFPHIPLQIVMETAINHFTPKHQELALQRMELLEKVLGPSHQEQA